MPVNQGGGGGRAGDDLTNDLYALEQPYELSGEMTAEKTAQLNEMLIGIYRSMRRAEEATRANDEALDALRNEFDGLGESLEIAHHTYTQAQILAGNTTPQEIVPAPGPGLIVVPMWAMSVKPDWSPGTQVGFNWAYADNRTFQLYYTSGPTGTTLLRSALAVGLQAPNTQLDSLGERVFWSDCLAWAIGQTDANPTHSVVNSALQLKANGDTTLGDTYQVFEVFVAYKTITPTVL